MPRVLCSDSEMGRGEWEIIMGVLLSIPDSNSGWQTEHIKFYLHSIKIPYKQLEKYKTKSASKIRVLLFKI